MRIYERSLELATAISDSKVSADILSVVAMIYRSLGSESYRPKPPHYYRNKALENFRECLILQRKVGDERGSARTLVRIALIRRSLGESVETRDEGLGAQQRVKDENGSSRRKAPSLGIGVTTSDRSGALHICSTGPGPRYYDVSQSLDYYKKALHKARATGDAKSEKSVLKRMAELFPQKQDGLEYYQQAVEVARRMGDSIDEAAILSKIASICREDARSYERLCKSKDFQSRGKGQFKGMWCTKSRVFHDKALAAFQEAIEALNRVGTMRGIDAVQRNIAEIHEFLKSDQKAMVHYEKGLAAAV